MSEEIARLEADVLAARNRVAASAEAVGYKTDVHARTLETVASTKDAIETALTQTIDTVKDAGATVAATTSAKASDLVEATKPHLATAASVATDVAHAAADATHTAAETVQVAAHTIVTTAQTVVDGIRGKATTGELPPA